MILLVDDEIFIVEMLKRRLSASQIETVNANCISDAINLIAQNEGIQVVITDLHFNYQTGFDLLDWLKKNRPEIKCIVLTAHPYEARLKDYEVEKVFAKPVNYDMDLIPFLKDLLSRLEH